MLSETTPTKVTFCELVEHPGGHDGGEFPQYHVFGVSDDGSVYYSTDLPGDCDTFCDEDEEDYKEVESLEEAKTYLANRHVELEEDLANVQRVLAAFDKATAFTTYFADEPQGGAKRG